jgi:hypothetical protein
MSLVDQRPAEMPPPVSETALGGFTISEFCKLYSISPPTYHNLQKIGRGPAEMRMGAVVRISREAAAAWQAARENPTGSEAEEVARNAAAMRERSRSAASKAAASPHHISSKRRGEA